MIPHAGGFEPPTSTTRALSIAVIEPTFGALAMAATGAPQTLGAGLGRAAQAAVDVAPVAAPADGEEALAARAPRQSQRRLGGIQGLRSVATRTRPTTLPNPEKRATIRVGRACVPSKTGARPLEDSERLLRVLTCFWQTVGHAGVRTHRALSTPTARHAATAGSALRAEARPSVERGVRPWVKDPWIRKSPVQAPERDPRQLSAECSEKAVST